MTKKAIVHLLFSGTSSIAWSAICAALFFGNDGRSFYSLWSAMIAGSAFFCTTALIHWYAGERE